MKFHMHVTITFFLLVYIAELCRCWHWQQGKECRNVCILEDTTLPRAWAIIFFPVLSFSHSKVLLHFLLELTVVFIFYPSFAYVLSSGQYYIHLLFL